MAVDKRVKVFHLSFKTRLHIIPNYCSGKASLKLFHQREDDGEEDTFLLSPENYEKIKQLENSLEKNEQYRLGQCVDVRVYTGVDTARYVCFSRYKSNDPEYPDFHMRRYCWEVLLCKEHLIKDAIKEVSREARQTEVCVKDLVTLTRALCSLQRVLCSYKQRNLVDNCCEDLCEETASLDQHTEDTMKETSTEARETQEVCIKDLVSLTRALCGLQVVLCSY